MTQSRIITGDRWEVRVGDVRHELQRLPANLAHCVVTSPPYWGLRDYGVEGQLGLEATPEEFIETMVGIFRQVRRVLRDDGVCWVNMGDSYASQGGAQVNGTKQTHGSQDGAWNGETRRPPTGLKAKDLCMIPARFALAMQADGWWLRSASPWVKRSAMPESTRDRPCTALEYVFQFTKADRYYFDMDAVRKAAAPTTIERDRYSRILENDGPQAVRHDHETQVNEAGRSMRNTDLWFESLDEPHGMTFVDDEIVGFDVVPFSFREAHFATYPPKLVKPLILSSTSERGCCAVCGSPWERVTERETYRDKAPEREMSKTPLNLVRAGWREPDSTPTTKTIGWNFPSCGHGADAVPCVVLDTFSGSGTTGEVATELGRRYIGLELNAEYAEMSARRIESWKTRDAVRRIESIPGQKELFG